MIKLFSKIIRVALGVIFLFAGSHIAFGANPWSYSFRADVYAPIQFLTFPTLPECLADFNTNTTAVSKSACDNVSSAGGITNARATQAAAQDANDAAAEVSPLDKFNLWCGLPLPGLSKYNLTDCIPSVIYYVIYKPASWILVGSGYVFDAMLTLSIDSSFINQEFVETTWLIVRDFSNMFFIFILIFTGVQTILNMGNWKNTVKLVIIMALLINFSLFFTKVIIDAGNILAVGIYSSIGMQKTPQEQSFRSVGPVPERNISGNLAGEFEPQRFLDTAGKVDALDATIVFIIAAIVSGFAGYVFFKVALLFIGRLVAFWFLMIVSPFAFISIALPGKANKFQDWLDSIVSQAFVVPVFLFLVYLIMQVINGGNGILAGLIKGSPTVGAFTFDKILGPVIVATIIIMALKQALDIASDMSGKIGGFVAGIAGQAMGVAGGVAFGVATGGAASLARGTVGKFAADQLASGNLKENSWQHKLATGATKASFDVRNLAGDKSILGKTVGGMLSKGGGKLGVNVGKGSGIGGVEKAEKERVEKILETAKAKEMNIFEQKGAHAREAKQKAAVTAAEEAKDAAQKAHESSRGAQMVSEKSASVDRERATAEEAKKKTEEAQKAHDTMRNSSSMRDPKIIQALEEAKKAEKEAMERLSKAEVDLATAQSVHDSSSTADDLKTATDAVEATRAQVVSATDHIAATNKARREEYAKKVEKGGRHATAEKVRKGEESGYEKRLKDLTAEKKAAVEAGKSSDVIEHIEEKIEKHKGNK